MQTPREIIADRYELLEVIGQGGQALVFRARDHEAERDVAVKVVSKAVSNDAEWVERMAREQQAMVALAGTSAVGFIDLCTSRTGALCLVMELLEGTDLEGFLASKEQQRERLPAAEVLRLMTPIVETLDKAHAVGIVHRDLKPGNIFIPRSGESARLLDFGFSRSKTSRNVTAAGTVVGSPSYIAPEMWLSRPDALDQRVDIYSLGVILFRMLAGELPFKGESLQQKFIAVTTGERPSLQALRPELPKQVDFWVERVLSIDPKERFPTIRASFVELSWALGLGEHPRERRSEPAPTNEMRRIREWLEAPFSGLPNTWNAARKFAKEALQRLKRLAFAEDEPPALEAAKPTPLLPGATDIVAPGESISEVLAWPGDASGTRPTLVLEQEGEHAAEMADFLAHAPTVAQPSEPPSSNVESQPVSEQREPAPPARPIPGPTPVAPVAPLPPPAALPPVFTPPPAPPQVAPLKVVPPPVAPGPVVHEWAFESTVLEPAANDTQPDEYPTIPVAARKPRIARPDETRRAEAGAEDVTAVAESSGKATPTRAEEVASKKTAKKAATRAKPTSDERRAPRAKAAPLGKQAATSGASKAAPAKKAVSKKVAGKKTDKKTAAKRAPAKKTAVKSAPAKKTVTKKAPAKKAPTKKPASAAPATRKKSRKR